MRAINAAYHVLSDPARRAAYDARRYLPRTVRVSTTSRPIPVTYQPAPAPASVVRPRHTVSRSPTGMPRRVERAVGVIGVLLLLAIGFYVANVIPYAEREFAAARSGTLPPLLSTTSAEHPVGAVPPRVRTDDGLRSFPATVLVAPERLEPFAALPVSRVDANGRGLARYAVYYGDWSAGGATITGLIGRAAFDNALPRLRDCAPDAAYCVGPAPGQTGGPPSQELFRASDLVDDYPAFASHRVCCNGVFWSLSWYEPHANMSYTIDLSRSLAASFSGSIAPDNVSAAHDLGALAKQLVRLP